MGDCGGVKERRHLWKLTTRKSGDPESTHVNGKSREGRCLLGKTTLYVITVSYLAQEKGFSLFQSLDGNDFKDVV